MAIPTDLLENCRIFCEKLQKMLDLITPLHILSNGNYEEEVKIIYTKISNKNDLKFFITSISAIILKSKKLYQEDNYAANLEILTKLVKEYDIISDKKNATNKINSISLNELVEIEKTFPNYYYELHRLHWINVTCKEYYKWLIDYTHLIYQPNKQLFGVEILPFSLKYFSISNFQCIKHIEAQLPVDAQFIVFTGENGDGKTSILQALSLGFYNTKDLRDNEKGNTATVITVQYKANENSYHNEIYNNPKFLILYSLRNNIEELKNFAAYGASRLQLESVESADNQKLLRSPIFNLFYSNAILQNIERWLRIRLLKGETERYNSVIELLVKLLPNVTAIEREDTADDVIFVYTEKGIKIPIEHLSSGHKSIVAMIGDMVIRLSSAQPEITNPKDFAGIVLIDELETHLHPKWQKEFPKILSDTFPKVQFIVTTHSAITLLGMPKNTVFFKVTRTEEEGTQIERLEIDVENLTPNLLLSSPIFGLADIFSVQNKGMENVHTGNFYDEKDTRQQAKDKIKSLYKQLKDKENNEKSN